MVVESEFLCQTYPAKVRLSPDLARIWPGFGPDLARIWPGFGPDLARKTDRENGGKCIVRQIGFD